MAMNPISRIVLAACCLAALTPLRSLAQSEPAAESRAFAAATFEARQNWRQSLARTPRPSRGCFRADFPEIQWRAVPCELGPQPLRQPGNGGGIRLETVGGTSGDMDAITTNGISQAEGSFDSVSTTGASDSLAGAGRYSLQINTEFFDTSLCSAHGTGSTCKGWEQFIYDNDGRTSMQYWIIDYGPPGFTCPAPHGAHCDGLHAWTDGWCEVALYSRTYCVTNSATTTVGAATPSDLANVVMQGNAPVAAGDTDTVLTTVSGSGLSVDGANHFTDLATRWHSAEFNVFGYGNSSTLNFNPNSTLVVRVGVDSGVNVAPSCFFHSYTAETNNLSIIDTAPNPPHNGHPSLVFTESNTGTADPSCAAGVSIGDTHLTTFDGVHYDFQAQGEFLLAEVANEFTVQVRQASGAPQWPDAAVNKAVAVRMGKTRVVFFVEPARVTIDGVVRPGGFERPFIGSDGVQVRRAGNVYTVSDRLGNRVRATLNSNWIDTAVMLGHTPSHVRGLLGNPGGNGSVLLTSTGAKLAAPVDFKDLYGKFTSGWQVAARKSLFGTANRYKFGVPAKPFYAQDLPPDAARRAIALCERAGVKDKMLLEDCILDVAVLKDEAAVRAFVNNAAGQGTVVKPVFGEPR